jgi:hypothetical protein
MIVLFICFSNQKARIVEEDEEEEVDDEMFERDRAKPVSRNEWNAGDKTAASATGRSSTVHASSEDDSGVEYPEDSF